MIQYFEQDDSGSSATIVIDAAKCETLGIVSSRRSTAVKRILH